MTREEFLRLAAEGYNRIPLAVETLADLDTPLSHLPEARRRAQLATCSNRCRAARSGGAIRSSACRPHAC